MTRSRFGHIDRRQFVTSAVVGGAATLTTGQPLRAGTNSSQPARLLTQDDSSDVPMLRGNPARTAEMPGPGPNASNGVEAIWTFSAGADEEYLDGSLAIVNGVAYAASGGASLYAVNAEDGTERWRFTTYDWIYPWAVVDGVVYATGDGKLYAIGARVPRLSVDGTARVAETIALRGGPSSTAVERAELEPDTVVNITAESEASGDVVWWPVVVNETGDQGWVEASKLEPLTSGPEPAATP